MKPLKTIVVQASNCCEKCRFNIQNPGSDNGYCLAYLKSLVKDDNGYFITLSDCVEVKKDDRGWQVLSDNDVRSNY